MKMACAFTLALAVWTGAAMASHFPTDSSARQPVESGMENAVSHEKESRRLVQEKRGQIVRRLEKQERKGGRNGARRSSKEKDTLILDSDPSVW